MTLNIPDITITSLETISVFDIATGNYKFTLDELQNATIAQSEESTEITGKAGRKLNSLKRNKSVTVSGTNGLISGGLLELQTGGEFENKATEVLWRDYLEVQSAGAETKFKAVGTTGAEIVALYTKNNNGSLGKELTQDATAAPDKFTYDPATRKLGFDSSMADGTEVIVVYKRKIQADVLENDSGKYSGKGAVYIDALGEDSCANIYRVQFYFPKTDISGEFSIDLGDNQSVHNFEFEALGGACGTSGQFYTYTVFGENEADL